jgi:hypothetical protein
VYVRPVRTVLYAHFSSIDSFKDGEEVTQQAMEEFAARFQGQVTQEVIDAMRVLFNIGSDDDDEVDQAIIQDGGVAALELAQEEDCTADV